MFEKVYRSRTNKVVAGVCGGMDGKFGISAELWRIMYVLLTLFGGIGILLYALQWMAMPLEPEEPEETEPDFWD